MEWLIGLSAPALALLASLFTYAMTALGALMILFSKKLPSRALAFMTGTASGIMIAASFFSLLLPAIEFESAVPPYITVTAGFFLGGCFIFLADYFIERVRARKNGKRNSLFFFAVTLHNVPEGLSVGVAFACAGIGDESALLAAMLFAFGIGVQNFPEGVCVAYSLRGEGMSVGKSFFYSQLSGSVEIVSALVGAYLVVIVNAILPWVLSFASGAMIAVTCSELIPEAFEKYKRLAGVGVIVGFAVMTLLDLAL